MAPPPSPPLSSADRGMVARALGFIRARATGLPGEYTFCSGGQVSLYASCYAAMALHYIGGLGGANSQERTAWCEYINGWQDPETGYFLGPELAPGQFARADMDATYARLHLIVHVVPALELLGGAPAHPLAFARAFADPDYLMAWLHQRDWRKAWLEGNKLLFAGQLLVYLRDKEGYLPATEALNLFFDWLDEQQDPATGLWGTNGFCGPYDALYGAYHQLLVYYACGRTVRHAERIINTVLALQQPDGSFSQTPGGGACEDADAVDVLVNLAKRTGYRTAEVRQALARTIPHILRQQAPDGGFVYRWGRSYMQSGVLRTFVPADQPDLFSSWFRLHTLALINEIVKDPVLEGATWDFNYSCSMGWHDRSVRIERGPAQPVVAGPFGTKTISAKKKLTGRGYDLLRRLPSGLILPIFRATLPRYLRALPAEEGLRALLEVEQSLDRLGREKSYGLAGGLDVRYWWSQAHRYYLTYLANCRWVVHLGCGDGSLSFTLASQSGAIVVASDAAPGQLAQAGSLFRHPRLTFVDPTDLATCVARPDVIVLTDLVSERPSWERWQPQWRTWPESMVLAQLTSFPGDWHQLPPAVTSGVMASSPVEPVERLVPADWRVLEATSLYGALHARLRSPGTHRQSEDVSL
jgi:hypothetical protein